MNQEFDMQPNRPPSVKSTDNLILTCKNSGNSVHMITSFGIH